MKTLIICCAMALLAVSNCFSGTVSCASGSSFSALLGTTCTFGQVQANFTSFSSFSQGNTYGKLTDNDLTLNFSHPHGTAGVMTINGTLSAAVESYLLGAAYQVVDLGINFSGGGHWGLGSVVVDIGGVDLVLDTEAAYVGAGCSSANPNDTAYVENSVHGFDNHNPGQARVCQPTWDQGSVREEAAAFDGLDFAQMTSGSYTFLNGTPEPGALILLGTGLLMVAALTRTGKDHAKRVKS